MQVIDNLQSSDTEQNQYTTVDELYKKLAVEEAMDAFIQHVEELAEKENQLNEKLRHQHLLINSLTNENKTLQEENARFRYVIENFLGNFQGLNKNVENGGINDQAKETMAMEELINKKNAEKETVESENIDLYRRNLNLERENKELKENMENLTKSVEKINNFILGSFNKKETKKLIEQKEATTKSKPSTTKGTKKSAPNSQNDINIKRSPITTRNRKGTKKIHTETVIDSVETWNEDLDEDFEVDVSDNIDEEEDEVEEYDVTPKKSRRKSVNAGSGKKSLTNAAGGAGMNKRAMNRDTHAANRNTILHQLFH